MFLRRILVVSILIFSCFIGVAQKPLSVKSKKIAAYYNEAINAYKSVQLPEALELLDAALEKEPLFIEAYLLKADIYEYEGKYEEAIIAYHKAIEIDPLFFPYLNYKLGKDYLINGEYEKGRDWLVRFTNQTNVRDISIKRAEYLIVNCDSAISLMNNPVDFNPIKLPSEINTDYDQYWPSVTADENVIVYTTLLVDSTRKNIYGQYALNEDIFISTRKNEEWQEGMPIQGRINTENNEGAPKISADGKVIVFTACNRHDGYGLCDIYFSFWTPEGWSIPVNAGPSINTKYSEKQPSLSPDNRELYFSSNRPKGKGELDIWRSTKDFSGNWQLPINLGDTINTPGDETSAFIHSDNKTMYYSSNGKFGLGNLDIFMTKRNANNEWDIPVNIGYPINTNKDEIGMIVNSSGNRAYYSSDDGDNITNIYYFDMPDKIKPTHSVYVSGKIFDLETGKPLEASFNLVDLNSFDTLMQMKAEKISGEYLVCLPSGNDYALNADFPDYLFHSENFTLKAATKDNLPYRLDIGLKKIKTGETIILNNIFFANDSYALLNESNVELSKIREMIVKNQNLKIEIGGYTDNTASKEYNKDLSVKRAKAVWEALELPENIMQNITYKGYGEDYPIGDNLTAEGRAKNRRTELKIIGK